MPTFKIVLAYDGTNFVGWDAEAPGAHPQIPGVDLAANARRLLRMPAPANASASG